VATYLTNLIVKYKPMNKLASLYFLYCTSKQCDVSVYHRMVDIHLPFNMESPDANYVCPYCHQPLVTAMDVETTVMPGAANYRKADKTHFLNN
jgi:hypothetical protein